MAGDGGTALLDVVPLDAMGEEIGVVSGVVGAVSETVYARNKDPEDDDLSAVISWSIGDLF